MDNLDNILILLFGCILGLIPALAIMIPIIVRNRNLKQILVDINLRYPSAKTFDVYHSDEKTFLKILKFAPQPAYGYLVIENGKLHFIGKYKSQEMNIDFDLAKCKFEWVGNDYRNGNQRWFKIISPEATHYFFKQFAFGALKSEDVFDELEKLQQSSGNVSNHINLNELHQSVREKEAAKRIYSLPFLIAGISALNLFLYFVGADMEIVVGLATTQFIYGFFAELGNIGIVIGLFISAIIIGIFVFCGYLAKKGYLAASVAALIIYFIDTLVIFILAYTFNAWEDVSLNIIFHGILLFSMANGIWINYKQPKQDTNIL